jgi:hypothetical protein
MTALLCFRVYTETIRVIHESIQNCHESIQNCYESVRVCVHIEWFTSFQNCENSSQFSCSRSDSVSIDLPCWRDTPIY